MATVLMVPGFGGTKLVSEGGFLRGAQQVWLPYSAPLTGNILALRLSDNGLRPYYPFVSRLLPGSRIDFYYPPIEEYLGTKGWQVVWSGDDWRLDIDRSALGLAQTIANIGSPDPVRIVAHSRGGLLVQQACRLLAEDNALSCVRQVVAVCCPFGGSYCAVPFLAGWALSSPENRGLWAVLGALDSVPFLSRFFRDICCSFPGLYELLPDPVLADANGGEQTANYYNPTTWSQLGRPVNPAHLADAAARWARRPSFPAGVRVDCIVGTDFPTSGAGGAVPGVVGPGRPIGGTGDGTVPDWSATLPGARSNTRFSVAHNESLRDPDVLAAIDALLRT